MTKLNQMDFFPSTSSQEDTLANLSPSQVEKKVKKIQDTSGQKCLDLSKNSDRLGLLERTLVDTLNSVSTPYLRTWRVKVTPQGHLVFQLRASAQTTKEKESGLWRTPDNMKGGSNLPGIKRALDQGHLKRPSGHQLQIRLQDQVQEKRLWPTPTANEDAAGRPGTKMQKMLGNHPEVRKPITGGTLNPTWVEWLMGYPSGWTDLSHSETAWFRTSPTTSDLVSSEPMKKNWPTPLSRDWKDGSKIPPSVRQGTKGHSLATKVLEEEEKKNDK